MSETEDGQIKLYQRVRRKVTKAIADFSMCTRSDRIAVALSGGKDSATLLYMLKKLNFNIEAFHVKLGIEQYTKKSLAYVEYICEELGVPLHIIDGPTLAGFEVDDTTKTYPGQQCGICGAIKRRAFNHFTTKNNFDILAVGHNMDDEAEMLFGNNLRWDKGYLAKSLPVLPANHNFAKRIKPLVYLREKEVYQFSKILPFDMLRCQCPHSATGSRKTYRKVLASAEEKIPRFVESYYSNFLKNASFLSSGTPFTNTEPSRCTSCGEPTSGQLCKICQIRSGQWRPNKKRDKPI